MALDNGVKGSKWFSLIDKVARAGTLQAAWRKVARNAGVDGQSVEKFAAQADDYLNELEAALKNGTYRPQPVKRVEIPKRPGQTRPLGIPAVKDRIVQTALKLVIEPIFERDFLDTSHGFRPGRGCKGALRQVDGLIKEGYAHVVDADLKSYFDSIPHERLMGRVEERISDGRILDLIRAYLAQDIVQGIKRWTPTGGTPQGAVISPGLSNLYLHPLDVRMKEKGYRMVRYADDFVVMCRTAEEAQAALHEVQAWVEDNGLTLHPDKTHVGDCREAGQGFDLPSLPLRSRAALGTQEEPEEPEGTHPGQDRTHTRGQSEKHHYGLEPDAQRLVWLLQARASAGISETGRVHPTAAACAAAQAGETAGVWALSGRSWSLAKCFLRGTGALHHNRSPRPGEPITMLKPPTGEPCAGEPHARFGGRGG